MLFFHIWQTTLYWHTCTVYWKTIKGFFWSIHYVSNTRCQILFIVTIGYSDCRSWSYSLTTPLPPPLSLSILTLFPPYFHCTFFNRFYSLYLLLYPSTFSLDSTYLPRLPFPSLLWGGGGMWGNETESINSCPVNKVINRLKCSYFILAFVKVWALLVYSSSWCSLES